MSAVASTPSTASIVGDPDGEVSRRRNPALSPERAVMERLMLAVWSTRRAAAATGSPDLARYAQRLTESLQREIMPCPVVSDEEVKEAVQRATFR